MPATPMMSRVHLDAQDSISKTVRPSPSHAAVIPAHPRGTCPEDLVEVLYVAEREGRHQVAPLRLVHVTLGEKDTKTEYSCETVSQPGGLLEVVAVRAQHIG